MLPAARHGLEFIGNSPFLQGLDSVDDADLQSGREDPVQP